MSDETQTKGAGMEMEEGLEKKKKISTHLAFCFSVQLNMKCPPPSPAHVFEHFVTNWWCHMGRALMEEVCPWEQTLNLYTPTLLQVHPLLYACKDNVTSQLPYPWPPVYCHVFLPIRTIAPRIIGQNESSLS